MLMREGVRNFQQGNYQRSIDLLEQVIRKDSLRLNAYVLLSASYLKQEIPEVAQLKTEEGLGHFPNSKALLWLKAEALFQQQLFKRAMPLYAKLYEEKAPTRQYAPLQIDSTHVKERVIQTNKALAAKAFQRNAFSEAETYINQIRDLVPEDLETQKNLVFLYLKQEKWEKALKAVNKALGQSPENRDLLRMKASALYQLQDYEGLQKEYKNLYEQDPDDIETALTYGEILIGSQQSSKAVKIYERLLEKYPKERRIYEALIDVNERRLNLDGKREVLRRMEKQFPNDNSIAINIAGTFEQQKEWGQARAVYDSLLHVSSDSLMLQKKIGHTYAEQDSLQKARKVYEDAYQNYKEDKELVLWYGMILEELSEWEKAYRLYSEFLSRHTDYEVLHRSGVALMQMDRYEQAIEQLQLALKNGSGNPDVYLRLSQLYVQVDPPKLKKARSKSERALTQSLQALQKSQRKIEQQLNKKSFGDQLENVRQFEKLEELDALAEKAFRHFTDINTSERIRQMFGKLRESYPGSGRLFYLMGDYYQQQNQQKLSRSHYEKAIRYSPQLRKAHLALAQLFEQAGQNKDAITAYERVLSLDAQKPEAYDALIRLYRKTEKLDKLCDRWKARYRGNTDNETLKEFLIEALHKAERYEEARKLINEE